VNRCDAISGHNHAIGILCQEGLTDIRTAFGNHYPDKAVIDDFTGGNICMPTFNNLNTEDFRAGHVSLLDIRGSTIDQNH